jgi:hypothetical protein
VKWHQLATTLAGVNAWLDAVRAFKTILNDDTLKIMDSPYKRWPLFGPRRTKQLDAKLAVGKWPW